MSYRKGFFRCTFLLVTMCMKTEAKTLHQGRIGFSGQKLYKDIANTIPPTSSPYRGIRYSAEVPLAACYYAPSPATYNFVPQLTPPNPLYSYHPKWQEEVQRDRNKHSDAGMAQICCFESYDKSEDPIKSEDDMWELIKEVFQDVSPPSLSYARNFFLEIPASEDPRNSNSDISSTMGPEDNLPLIYPSSISVIKPKHRVPLDGSLSDKDKVDPYEDILNGNSSDGRIPCKGVIPEGSQLPSFLNGSQTQTSDAKHCYKMLKPSYLEKLDLFDQHNFKGSIFPCEYVQIKPVASLTSAEYSPCDENSYFSLCNCGAPEKVFFKRKVKKKLSNDENTQTIDNLFSKDVQNCPYGFKNYEFLWDIIHNKSSSDTFELLSMVGPKPLHPCGKPWTVQDKREDTANTTVKASTKEDVQSVKVSTKEDFQSVKASTNEVVPSVNASTKEVVPYVEASTKEVVPSVETSTKEVPSVEASTKKVVHSFKASTKPIVPSVKASTKKVVLSLKANTKKVVPPVTASTKVVVQSVKASTKEVVPSVKASTKEVVQSVKARRKEVQSVKVSTKGVVQSFKPSTKEVEVLKTTEAMTTTEVNESSETTKKQDEKEENIVNVGVKKQTESNTVIPKKSLSNMFGLLSRVGPKSEDYDEKESTGDVVDEESFTSCTALGEEDTLETPEPMWITHFPTSTEIVQTPKMQKENGSVQTGGKIGTNNIHLSKDDDFVNDVYKHNADLWNNLVSNKTLSNTFDLLGMVGSKPADILLEVSTIESTKEESTLLPSLVTDQVLKENKVSTPISLLITNSSTENRSSNSDGEYQVTTSSDFERPVSLEETISTPLIGQKTLDFSKKEPENASTEASIVLLEKLHGKLISEFKTEEIPAVKTPETHPTDNAKFINISAEALSKLITIKESVENLNSILECISSLYGLRDSINNLNEDRINKFNNILNKINITEANENCFHESDKFPNSSKEIIHCFNAANISLDPDKKKNLITNSLLKFNLKEDGFQIVSKTSVFNISLDKSDTESLIKITTEDYSKYKDMAYKNALLDIATKISKEYAQNITDESQPTTPKLEFGRNDCLDFISKEYAQNVTDKSQYTTTKLESGTHDSLDLISKEYAQNVTDKSQYTTTKLESGVHDYLDFVTKEYQEYMTDAYQSTTEQIFSESHSPQTYEMLTKDQTKNTPNHYESTPQQLESGCREPLSSEMVISKDDETIPQESTPKLINSNTSDPEVFEMVFKDYKGMPEEYQSSAQQLSHKPGHKFVMELVPSQIALSSYPNRKCFRLDPRKFINKVDEILHVMNSSSLISSANGPAIASVVRPARDIYSEDLFPQNDLVELRDDSNLPRTTPSRLKFYSNTQIHDDAKLIRDQCAANVLKVQDTEKPTAQSTAKWPAVMKLCKRSIGQSNPMSKFRPLEFPKASMKLNVSKINMINGLSSINQQTVATTTSKWAEAMKGSANIFPSTSTLIQSKRKSYINVFKRSNLPVGTAGLSRRLDADKIMLNSTNQTFPNSTFKPSVLLKTGLKSKGQSTIIEFKDSANVKPTSFLDISSKLTFSDSPVRCEKLLDVHNKNGSNISIVILNRPNSNDTKLPPEGSTNNLLRFPSNVTDGFLTNQSINLENIDTGSGNVEISSINLRGVLKYIYNHTSSLLNQHALAHWNYSTSPSNKTQHMCMTSKLEIVNCQRQMNKILKTYLLKTDDPDLKRQIKLLYLDGLETMSDIKMAELGEVLRAMEKIYFTATVPDYKNPNGHHNLSEIMEKMKSDDPNECRFYWHRWYEASGKKLKHHFEQYLELIHSTAIHNGFKDVEEMWTRHYEKEDFSSIVCDKWDEIRPLYMEMHAYIRFCLLRKYGNIGKHGYHGPIPAHYTRDLWAEDWSNIYNACIPFPDKPLVYTSWSAKGSSMLMMQETCEDFFESIGLGRLPKDVWAKSLLSQTLMVPSGAWDMNHPPDFRISMYYSGTFDNFVDLHKLIGIVACGRTRVNLPLPYRRTPCPGFDDGIAGALALAVQTPVHVSRVGLLSPLKTNDSHINFLFKLALHTFMPLPFYLSVDHWRYNVFNGTYPPSEMNYHWWSSRQRCCGVCPALWREFDDFDPGAKYEVISNQPYMKKFVAGVMQFQIYEALCQKSGALKPGAPLHTCDLYGSQNAGEILKTSMEIGASKHWESVLDSIGGSNHLSGNPLMNYFKPLYQYLKETNFKNRARVGWNDDGIDAVF